MEQGITFTPQPKRIPNELHFRAADWLALLGTLICAAGYAFLHPSLFDYNRIWSLPGIGLTISCWLMLAVCMGYIGWRRLHWTIMNRFLMAATLLLSACYGIFANSALRLMNMPVLAGLFILTVYSLRNGGLSLDENALCASLRYAFASTTSHIPIPVRAIIAQCRNRNNRRLMEMLLGLAICVPVVGLVVFLLCDADSMFGSLVLNMFSGINGHTGAIMIWKLVRMVVVLLLMFGFVYGLNRTLPKSSINPTPRKSLSAVTVSTLLSVMSLVYGAFVYIQCRYLFAGKTAAVVEGSYAAYARSGFFQLVIVAMITMLVVLPALCRLPSSPMVRILSGFVTLMTMVIVFSAFWRMRLYILEYGFTFLRAVTLWGILAITAAMIGAFLKAVHPKMRIFRPLFVFAVCTWIAFNFVNVDARIAEYNIATYESGARESVDLYYLALLSPDALPALREFAENHDFVELTPRAREACKEIAAREPSAYDWSLSWLKAKS